MSDLILIIAVFITGFAIGRFYQYKVDLKKGVLHAKYQSRIKELEESIELRNSDTIR